MPAEEALRFSAAAERNKEPILEVLRRVLPARGAALEIASGSGQHLMHFAAGLPDWSWQPTDTDPAALASIAAHRALLSPPNVRPPRPLDVTGPDWPATAFDLVLCANLLHIAPWSAACAMLAGAGRHLAAGGLLVLYGPFLIDGEATAPSNLAFDADLRARNPLWGLRRLADVVAQAGTAGFALRERVHMPANNQLLVLARAA